MSPGSMARPCRLSTRVRRSSVSKVGRSKSPRSIFEMEPCGTPARRPSLACVRPAFCRSFRSRISVVCGNSAQRRQKGQGFSIQMSILPFKRIYSPLTSLLREKILALVDRPWAYGLSRLLTARPGLKKGVLADLADIKGGTISGLLNGPKPPHVATLQKIADAITAYDRDKNPHAPDVQLWEFFVTDEQAAILRESASQRRQIASEDRLIDRVLTRLAPIVTTALQEELSGTTSEAPAHKKKRTA